MSSKLLSPSGQIAFHQLLIAARKKYLVDALSEALEKIDPQSLRGQIALYVPSDVQKILAAAGIRDEYVFPLPAVLKEKPTLIGYYRLLLGVSQKRFYRAGTGMSEFKNMEVNGLINSKKTPSLEKFSKIISEHLAELVRQIPPKITDRDISELQLLTLGAQLYGGNNNAIGKQATLDVFLSVAEIIKNFVTKKETKTITLINASKRKVVIALGSDPDIRILEDFNGQFRNKVAIEIKGGTDVSNVHNRAGEAEKSHQKAKKQEFRNCWTIISKTGVAVSKLKEESPTTTSWFDVAQVLARKGPDWNEFRSRIAEAVGIPIN